MAAEGTWNITIETPMGTRRSTCNFTVDGNVLKGTQAQGSASTEIRDGTVEGNQVSWRVSINDPMPMTVTFTGTVEGDQMSGNADTGTFGSFPFTGSRA